MKKYSIISMLILSVLFTISQANAGTLSFGAQAWNVKWDSGMAKMNTQAIENQIEKELDAGVLDLGDLASYEGLNVGDPETKGFIYGPRLSYETDDKKWEFQGSMMLFGSYTTTVDSKVLVSADFPIVGSITQALPINTEMEIKYKEINLRAKRMISDNFGIFAGSIYQSYSSEMDSDYNFTFNFTSMTSSLDFKLDSWMIMVYAGLSCTCPIGSIFSINGNIGCGMPAGGNVEQEMNISGSFFNNDITNDGGKIKMAFMGLGDITMAIKIAGRVSLELGYQYRRLMVNVEELDLDADGNANESAKEVDIFHGMTFAATYLISL